MTSPVPVLTIDGPSGAGKGTVSQRLSEKLKWHYLDSGALYRVLAVAADRAGLGATHEPQLGQLAANMQVEFRPNLEDLVRVELDGEDVSGLIRTEVCGNKASELAALPQVRAGLLDLQHRMRQSPGLVADGRDMGTVVFPDAVTKIFLTASPEIRAQRRHKQLMEKGLDVTLPRLISEIRERDLRDAGRAVSPLRPAEDAFQLDSSCLDIDAVVDQIMQRLREAHVLESRES